MKSSKTSFLRNCISGWNVRFAVERTGSCSGLTHYIQRLLHKGESLCCFRDSASVTYGCMLPSDLTLSALRFILSTKSRGGVSIVHLSFERGGRLGILLSSDAEDVFRQVRLEVCKNDHIGVLSTLFASRSGVLRG